MKPLLLLLSSALLAQITPPTTLVFVTSDPVGACSPASTPLRYNSSNGKLWSCQGSAWTLVVAGGGGGGTPGSPDTSVQTNQGGTFTGNAGFTWNNTTKSLTVNNTAVPTGSELITDGNFTTCPGAWTFGSDVACVGGKAVSTYAGGNPSLTSNTFATVSGTTYLLTFTISDVNAKMYYTWGQNGNDWRSNNSLTFGNGTHSLIVVTDYTGSAETLTFDDDRYSTGDTWTLDNVSFREVPSTDDSLVITGSNGSTSLSLGLNNQDNLMIGSRSTTAITTAYGNVGVGSYALSGTVSGTQNTAVGEQALADGPSSSVNTAVGFQALQLNTGNNNTAVGNGSLSLNISGEMNTAIGSQAMEFHGSGNNNTSIGFEALGVNLTGSGNVALGARAGLYETGSNAFYVDNRNRTDTAGDKAGAILYGTFNATPTSQTLNTPGRFSANFLQGGGAAPSVATCGTIGTGSTNAAGFITTVTGSCVPVMTFASATATTGWGCAVNNKTTPANIFQQTNYSTTTATFTGVSGANDVVIYACTAF